MLAELGLEGERRIWTFTLTTSERPSSNSIVSTEKKAPQPVKGINTDRGAMLWTQFQRRPGRHSARFEAVRCSECLCRSPALNDCFLIIASEGERMNEEKIAPKLTNVFVLMLENHSFDNIFATSRIPGITAATVEDFNFVEGKKYFVQDGAPWCMTTDPGHEFDDVLEQLCGYDAAQSYQGGAYPTIDNSGFASNYATSTSELTGLPDKSHVVDIMSCFDTRSQLPVIHQLACEFAICDHWFSSIPGPTWANRFFVHGASS